MLTVTIIYESTWTKGNRVCRVYSRKKGDEKKSFFWFAGDNPFPCFNMSSTFVCVSKWLAENGWQREINSRTTYINDVINDETGELIDHSTVVYNYVPAREIHNTIEIGIDDMDCIYED